MPAVVNPSSAMVVSFPVCAMVSLVVVYLRLGFEACFLLRLAFT